MCVIWMDWVHKRVMLSCLDPCVPNIIMKKKKTLFRSKYCWLGEWNSILLMAKMKAFCVALSKVVCDARVSTFLLGWYSQRSAVNGHKISPLQSTIVTITITSTSNRRYKYPSSTHFYSNTGSRYVPQSDLDRECCQLVLLPIFQSNKSRSKTANTSK